MFYEEKFYDGVWYCRDIPGGTWVRKRTQTPAPVFNAEFTRKDFIAYRTPDGGILMQDSPNGWGIGLDGKDMQAFKEWLGASGTYPN